VDHNARHALAEVLDTLADLQSDSVDAGDVAYRQQEALRKCERRGQHIMPALAEQLEQPAVVPRCFCAWMYCCLAAPRPYFVSDSSVLVGAKAVLLMVLDQGTARDKGYVCTLLGSFDVALLEAEAPLVRLLHGSDPQLRILAAAALSTGDLSAEAE